MKDHSNQCLWNESVKQIRTSLSSPQPIDLSGHLKKANDVLLVTTQLKDKRHSEMRTGAYNATFSFLKRLHH